MIVPALNGWLRSVPAPPSLSAPRLGLVGPQRLGATPEDECVIPSDVDIMEQLQVPGCVSNAIVDAYEIVGEVPPRSRRHLWWNARNARGEANQVVGTWIHVAFATAATVGISLESECPYSDDPKVIVKRPPLGCLESGWTRKLDRHRRLASAGLARCDELEAEIRAGRPGVGGFQVGQQFVDYRGEDVVWHPPHAPIGDHAMCIDGVRRVRGVRHFRLRNSWGLRWGMRGLAWAHEDWIADPFSGDFHTVRHA